MPVGRFVSKILEIGEQIVSVEGGPRYDLTGPDEAPVGVAPTLATYAAPADAASFRDSARRLVVGLHAGKVRVRRVFSIEMMTEVRLRGGSCLAGAVLVLASATVALAQEPAPDGFDYGEIAPVFEDPLDRTGYISLGPIDAWTDRYFEWKEKLGADYGISYLIEDRLINQWGGGAAIYDNEVNLVGRAELVDSDRWGTGAFMVWGQFAQSLGNNTGSEFQADVGVLSPLNGGNSGPDSSNEILQMLVWEQIMLDDRFRVQVGKLSTRTLVNLNRYADGDSLYFFSPMLGNNTVVPYTALLGSGVFAQWKEKLWYVSGLARGADTEKGISFDAIEDGDFQYVGEVALTPTLPGIGYGEYRLTLSYDEETDERPDVFTISASLDQDIGERVGGFFRVAYSDDTWRAFETRVAGGFQLKQPFGFRHDRTGIGAWYGKPTNDDLDSEYGVEIFYKAQVQRFFEITPNFQLVADPALSDDSVEAIVGLRLRAAF